MNVVLNLPSRENKMMADEINSVITDVLASGYYLLGDQVKAFEQEFAAFCTTKYCISVGNGTDALEIGLRSLGVRRGDEVVTVANAGGYTTTACNIIGAIPVYVDVRSDDLLLDIDSALQAVSDKTRCVVTTHLYGQPVNVVNLRTALNDTGYAHVRILEDCAQAHGATVDGKPVGSMGDIATFSFYPTKNLGALGDGGAIITNSRTLAETCCQLRQYGWQNKYESVTPFGRNSRLDELQAAILRVKLKHLPELNRRRIRVAESISKMLEGRLDVVTKPVAGYVGHLFVVRHSERERIRGALSEHGIMTDIHYPILDLDQLSMQSMSCRSMNLDNSRKASHEIFSLPCYACLSNDELCHMQQAFDLYISKNV